MTILYSAVRNIIIYLILITIVTNLMGNSSYKKYVGIFTGMLLIIIVLLPIMEFLNISDKLTYYLDVNNFKVKADDISAQLMEAKEEQKDVILSNYKKSLQEQITTRISIHDVYPTKIELVIEEDTSSTQYGMLQSLSIEASKTKQVEEDVVMSKTKIDEVVIDKIDINGEDELRTQDPQNQGQDNLDSLLELNIKQELASFFSIKMENVSIEVVK